MQDIKETLAAAFKLGFKTANIGLKSALLPHFGDCSSEYDQQNTHDITLIKSVNHFLLSDAFVNALVKDVYRHPVLVDNLAEPVGRTTNEKGKDGV